MIEPIKITIVLVLLGAASGALIALGAQISAVVAASIAVLPIIITALPAFIARSMEHLKRLASEFDFVFVPWMLLFVSGLVFRTRDLSTIQDNPIDAWALFRIAVVGLALLIIVTFYIRGRRSVRCFFQGFPGMFIAWALLGAVSTPWSASPAWTLYKSLEYGIDVAVLVTIIASVKTIEDCRKIFDWTWILLFGLLVTVWLGAVIWPDEALDRGVGMLGVQLAGVVPSVAANGVGELAALVGIVCLGRVIYSPRRICYGAVFLCCCATLIFAQTRSALAAFLGAGLSILIATKRYISAVIIVAVGTLWAYSGSADNFWEYLRRGQDTEEINNLSGRTAWWGVAIEKIKERPLLGYGAYSGGRFVVSSALGAENDVSTIHNDYLEIVLGTGVVGLSIVLIAIAGVGFTVFSASKKPMRSELERAITVEAVAVFTLVMIRSMFSTTLFWHPPLPFLLVVGYADLLRRRAAEYQVTCRRRYEVPAWADAGPPQEVFQ